MPNGTGLKGHPSSAQSAVIVPKPGSATNYIIVTQSVGNGTMNFFEVDMTLNAGLGDVLSSNKNTQLMNNSAEKIAVTRHDNGLWYWVIGHRPGTSKIYNAFLLDCDGINTTPVVSQGAIGGSDFGYMVASPQGDKLAIASSEIGVEIVDFNSNTGQVSNPINLGRLRPGPGSTNVSNEYGIAFSPNGKVLYALDIKSWLFVQWNL